MNSLDIMVLIQRITMTSERASTCFISLLVTVVMMMMAVPSNSQEQPSCPIVQGYEPSLTKTGADLTIALMLELHDAGGDEFVCDFNGPVNLGQEQAQIAATAATDNWPDSIQLPGLSVGK